MPVQDHLKELVQIAVFSVKREKKASPQPPLPPPPPYIFMKLCSWGEIKAGRAAQEEELRVLALHGRTLLFIFIFISVRAGTELQTEAVAA